MEMTHYMELLASNQPWNLILFMAVPVILAETVAITELYLLLTKDTKGWVKSLSRFAGITGGIYFIWVFLYLLFTAFIPLTTSGSWRGLADIIAVSSYLLCVIPLVGIALSDLNLIGKDESQRNRLHALFVAIFLVIAHVAMIFGMLAPSVLGFEPAATEVMDHMNM